MSKISYANGNLETTGELNTNLEFELIQSISQTTISSTALSSCGLWLCMGDTLNVVAHIYKRKNVYSEFVYVQTLTENSPGHEYGASCVFSDFGIYLVVSEARPTNFPQTHVYKRNENSLLYEKKQSIPTALSSSFRPLVNDISSDGTYMIVTYTDAGTVSQNRKQIIRRTPGTETWVNLGNQFSTEKRTARLSRNGNYITFDTTTNIILYKKTSETTWSIEQALPNGQITNLNFGSINDNGTIIAIFNQNINSNIGGVKIYEQDGLGSWLNTHDINPQETGLSTVVNEYFGRSGKLTADGSRLFVYSQASIAPIPGRIWVYDNTQNGWIFRGRLNDVNIVNNLNHCIDATGSHLIVQLSSGILNVYKLNNSIKLANIANVNSLVLSKNDREVKLYAKHNTSKHNIIFPPFNKKGKLINNKIGELQWNNTNQSLSKYSSPQFTQLNLSPSTNISKTNSSLILSLRHINVDYTNNCIEIRRSSDDQTQNIGFDNGVVDIGSILNFSGNSNIYIRTWYDQSENGNDFIQTTDSNQPQLILHGPNNLPTILFDGVDDFFDGGDILDIETNVGWFANVIGQANTNNGSFIAKELNTVSSNRWSLRYGSTTFNSVFHDSAETSTSTSKTANSSQEIISLNIDRNDAIKSLGVFINNGLLTSTTITENNTYLHNSVTRCLIGTRSDATDVGEIDYLDGTISEIIIYNNVITNIQRQGIEQNQSNYYNITLNSEIPKISIKVDNTISADYTINIPNSQSIANQTLLNDGSGNLSWQTKDQDNILNETTTSITLNNTHDSILCSNSSGCTVTLPDANTFIGKEYKIINFNATGSIIINRSGSDTIDNALTTTSLATEHERISIVSVGNAQWYTF
jgi:hypothetical protein